MSKPKRTRCLAIVGPLAGERRITQTTGFPIDAAQVLPAPDVVLMIAGPEPGAMLFRYTATGEFGGDTWHPTMESAGEQAMYEYEDALGDWVHVPEDVEDAHGYAILYAAARLNRRERS